VAEPDLEQHPRTLGRWQRWFRAGLFIAAVIVLFAAIAFRIF
jgi:hypothetical protein